MAQTNIDNQVNQIISKVKLGEFSPIYLLMGTEPYYLDLVCEAIIKNALTDNERAFNQDIWFGMDVKANDVAMQCRSYPAQAERRLVVVKNAQSMDLENLIKYCASPSEFTVLVLVVNNSLDKRKAIYKSLLDNINKHGVILESNTLKDYQMPNWVVSFLKNKGINIAPKAVELFVESVGTSMVTIAAETDKILKNLPEGTKEITVEDIEKNVGISRQFNIFELSNALSYKDAKKAFKIATHIGDSHGFYILMATSSFFTHFTKILKYKLFLEHNKNASDAQKATAIGVNSYFLKDYNIAINNYSLKKLIQIVGLLEEYDFKGKGGNGEQISQKDLLMELVVKILN